MADNTVFPYQPLVKNSVRFVNLLPGHPSEDLRCTIVHSQFPYAELDYSFEPPYEALYYTWGSTNECPYHITSNDIRIPIRQSLYDALQQLRKPDANRLLWIDALCINQLDDTEKEVMIPLMKHIYAHAAHVLIWLGLEDEFTADALAIVDQAARTLREETGNHIPLDLEIFRESNSAEKYERRGFHAFGDKEWWKPLLQLWSRPWFSRTWVVQESVMATSAMVMIGSFERDWSDFGVAAMFFAFKAYSGPVHGMAEVLEIVNGIWSLSRLATRRLNFKTLPLLLLLWLTQRRESSDPLDKVYSLLGLADEEEEFRADYTKSEKEIFIKVAMQLLRYPNPKVGHPLALLAGVKHYREQQLEDWPSWVPRWHEKLPTTKDAIEKRIGNIYIMSNIYSSTKFWAGGRGTKITIPDPLDPYMISVEGLVFATISTNVNFLEVGPLSRGRLWDLVLDIWSVRKSRGTPYPAGESIDKAFAQTLTLSTTVEFTDKPEAEMYHGIDFTHFCLSLFDQTVAKMGITGDSERCEAMKQEFKQEYAELKDEVGDHVKSATFSTELQNTCLGRKLFGTIEGYIGLGDITLQADDLVCILFGGKVSFILRKVEGGYRFVGECYLHGIMLGEALEEGRKRSQSFKLR